MEAIILGCGSSSGVPVIGCSCKVCHSTNPRNKRSRTSVLFRNHLSSVLIDTATDLRSQALANNITHIDGVIYTHAHADHINGLDDLRSFNYLANKPIPVYGTPETLSIIKTSYPYAFLPHEPKTPWYKPALLANEITPGADVNIGKTTVHTFEQQHAGQQVLGVRIQDLAYSTDVNMLPPSAFAALEGVKIWIVDCLSYKQTRSHAHLDLTLDWIKMVNPQRAILIHMSHDLDYDDLTKKLPSHIEPAYDGMIISID